MRDELEIVFNEPVGSPEQNEDEYDYSAGDSTDEAMSAQDLFNLSRSRLANPDLEKRMLAHIIASEYDQVDLITKLNTDDFSIPVHAKVFEILQEMFEKTLEISKRSIDDIISVKVLAKDLKFVRETLYEIFGMELNDSVGNAVALLKELTKNRKISKDILEEGGRMFDNGEPTEDIIEHMTNVLITVEEGREEKRTDRVTDNVVDSILNPEATQKGLKLGLAEIDLQFGGIKPDTLYVIGAESGMGKTAITVDLMERLCSMHGDKIKILFFSMEMSEERIVKRLISRKTGLNNQALEGRMKSLTPEQRKAVKDAGDKIRKYPIEIVYNTMTVNAMKRRARKFALKNKGKHLIIMLDHLGLIQGATNDMRVNTILGSAACKSFCVDYKASVFELTQFTKEINSNENKKNHHRPHMGYIMESGRVRQDADVVWLLWRPEVYTLKMNYGGEEEWDTTGKMIILNEKNRDGHAPNDIIMSCDISTNKIENSNTPFG